MRGLSIFFGCLIAGSATAETYLVGDTQFDGCDFANIQDAIDAAQANGFYGNKILVTNSGSYTDQVLHIADTTLIIEGGCDSCVSWRTL